MPTHDWQRRTQLHILNPVGVEIVQHAEYKVAPVRPERDQSVD